jgi:hypothetical protein
MSEPSSVELFAAKLAKLLAMTEDVMCAAHFAAEEFRATRDHWAKHWSSVGSPTEWDEWVRQWVEEKSG